MSTTVSYNGSTITTVSNETKTLTTAGTWLEDDITLVDSSASSPTLQAKTNITPIQSSQTITADSGYDGLSSVQINAIPESYKDSIIFTATYDENTGDLESITCNKSYSVCSVIMNDAYDYSAIYVEKEGEEYSISAMTGTEVYNPSSNEYLLKYTLTDSNFIISYHQDGTITASERNASATTPATTITANPSISVDSSTGLITATASASQSVTPTVVEGYISSGTAGTVTVSGSNTSQLTTQAAQTIHPSTSDQTITSGKYLTGTQTIKGVTVTNLTAANIVDGVTVKIGDSTDDDCVTSVTGSAVLGEDVPVFTVTWDSNWSNVTSIICNKTYAECLALYENECFGAFAISTNGTDEYKDSIVAYKQTSVDISYVFAPSLHADITYDRLEQISYLSQSAYPDSVTITQNGNYTPSDFDYRPFWGVTVNVPGGNSPIFTLTFNNNHTAITSVTCNKTFAECVALMADRTALFKIYTGSTYEGDSWAYNVYSEVNNNEYTKIVYSSSSSLSGAFVDVTYESDGTITGTYPSAYALTLNATTNGTYNTNNHGTYTEVNVNVPTGTARTSSDLTVSGDTVTVPAGLYSSQATASVASGTAGTPTATKGTVSNNSISVTPSVTNTTGYITGSTKTGTAVTVSASELVSGTLNITSSGTKDVTNYASASVAAGTEGTPTATKGTVSNHQVSITPSVTNTAGYISGSTKTGTAVTVTASELASGNKAITSNGTGIDVVGYSTVSVAVEGEVSMTDVSNSTGTTAVITGETTTLTTKTITQNGTYTASTDGADGYSSVTVNVSGGSSSDTWDIVHNGNVTISAGSPNFFMIQNYTEPMELNDEYRITWGNITHTFTPLADPSGSGYYIGNPVLNGGLDDGSGISLILYPSDSNRLTGETTDSIGTKYLKIEKKTSGSSGSSVISTSTGTFTGSGGNTVQISCDFEPQEIYIYGDLTSDATLRGIVSVTIVKDTVFYMTSDGAQNNTDEYMSGLKHEITGYNESNSSTEPYASYSNGTLTINTFVNSIAYKFASEITYNYKLVGMESPTQHTIHLEFSDSSETDIALSYNDSLIGTMITAYAPNTWTYNNKQVLLAELDNVAWYDKTNIPIGVELVDISALTFDTFVDPSTGEEQYQQWYAVTDYLPISYGMTFSVGCLYWSNINFYDSNQDFISVYYPAYNGWTQNSQDSEWCTGTLTGSIIPQNASYVRLHGTNFSDNTVLSYIRTA